MEILDNQTVLRYELVMMNVPRLMQHQHSWSNTWFLCMLMPTQHMFFLPLSRKMSFLNASSNMLMCPSFPRDTWILLSFGSYSSCDVAPRIIDRTVLRDAEAEHIVAGTIAIDVQHTAEVKRILKMVIEDPLDVSSNRYWYMPPRKT